MSLVVRAAREQVLEAAARVLIEDFGARNVSAGADGQLRGRTRPTWRSWGEDLTVRIDPDEQQIALRVRVDSHSLLRAVQFDWGKNGSNERHFYHALRDRMEQFAPGSVIWPPSPRRDGGVPS